MRVISGTARSLLLNTVSGLSTRPTSDKLKEALFSMLAPDLEESDFLDLFSGSGAIGIEALSRGAASAVFVDNSFECAKVIEANLKHTKLIENATVLSCDYKKAIVTLKNKGARFDIIFMDPPYGGSFVNDALSCIADSGLLKPGGFIVCEQSSRDEAPECSAFTVFKEKRYKTSAFIFLSANE